MKIEPSLTEFKTLARDGNLVSVCSGYLADTDTPVSAYLKLRSRFGPLSFLLESAEFGRAMGRYSFIGCDPFIVVLVNHAKVEVWKGAANEEFNPSNPLEVLRAISKNIAPAGPDLDIPFQGGLVGYLNYDLIRKWERLPDLGPYGQEMPEALFIAPRRVVVFDHLSHKIIVMYQVWLDDQKDAESQYGLAVEAISQTIKILQGPLPGKEGDMRVSPLFPNKEKSQFEQMVCRAKRYIEAGDVIQVVLSQRFSARASGDSFALYRRLRSLNPSPYMFYLDFGQIRLIGSSPEMLVRLTGSTITLRPIAGTRPRGKSEQQDKLFERELLADEKERAEHVMLVDLGRNDVGRVAAPGSVRVNKFMEVDRYSHVMHLVSDIEGSLRPDKDCFDVFMSAFPAGTVTGAPKVRAMEIINELEACPRGPYAGAVGYFGFNGNMDFCITIRTIVVMKDELWLQAGAGIVYDSVPEAEYEETLSKARALIKVMEEPV